jgi:hypothetical protein
VLGESGALTVLGESGAKRLTGGQKVYNNPTMVIIVEKLDLKHPALITTSEDLG